MGLISGILKTAIHTVTLPLAIAKDVVNLGDTDETSKKVSKIGRSIESSFNGPTFL